MLMQPQSLDDLSAEQLREMTARLPTELRHSQALNAKLTRSSTCSRLRQPSKPSSNQTPAAASPSTAPRDQVRARVDRLPVRLPDAAHRRRRGREARLCARCVHGERHVRGKWACAKCETITQAPVAAHVIDKGIPTTCLLAQVLVASPNISPITVVSPAQRRVVIGI